MAGISRYEKCALLLTAGFVLFTGGWFWASHTTPEPYTVVTQAQGGEQTGAEDDQSADASAWPESLLEGERIDLNTADVYDLDRLPGIGPAKAEAIAAYRAEHGPFQSVDQLLEVSGIGEATLEALRPYLMISDS